MSTERCQGMRTDRCQGVSTERGRCRDTIKRNLDPSDTAEQLMPIIKKHTV